MKIQDIPRVKLQGAVEAPENMLADDAATLLGYKAGTRTVVKVTPLAAALAELDIEPLEWRAVRRYQFEAAAAANTARLAEVTDPDFQDWRSELEWTRTPISKYAEPIPDYVLNKAIQIKRALPDVEIIVEALQQNPDPFLIVRVKDGYRYEGYYVEVWDERSFVG